MLGLDEISICRDDVEGERKIERMFLKASLLG